ncbi:hypothetical protein [Olsenella sp. oral taxon 809]|nr:hypothetical protein [Olsenella sp. oral taxon 809]
MRAATSHSNQGSSKPWGETNATAVQVVATWPILSSASRVRLSCLEISA